MDTTNGVYENGDESVAYGGGEIELFANIELGEEYTSEISEIHIYIESII